MMEFQLQNINQTQNCYIYLYSKLKNFISFLDSLKAVQESNNREALKTFLDVAWLIGYVNAIKSCWDRDPNSVIKQMFLDAQVDMSKFNEKELNRIKEYLAFFVLFVTSKS